MNQLFNVAVFFGLLMCLGNSATAAVPVGEPLPAIAITEKGELVLSPPDKVHYEAWATSGLAGRVHVIQYLAGRISAPKINRPFTDRLGELRIESEYYHVTTIINLNDTLFGTSAIVASQLKRNKRKYPASSIVADEHGDGAKLWRLNPGNSAIFILSPQGKVLFFKDGSLNNTEIEQAVDIIRIELARMEAGTELG